jgi:DNA-binding transcriptional regulator YiaG
MSAMTQYGRIPRKLTRNRPIATEIREIRHKLNMTQAQFAHEIGVERSMISRWENGSVRASAATMKLMRRTIEDYNRDAVKFVNERPWMLGADLPPTPPPEPRTSIVDTLAGRLAEKFLDASEESPGSEPEEYEPEPDEIDVENPVEVEEAPQEEEDEDSFSPEDLLRDFG